MSRNSCGANTFFMEILRVKTFLMDIFQGYEEIFNGFLYSGMKKTQPTARREGGWGGGGGSSR